MNELMDDPLLQRVSDLMNAEDLVGGSELDDPASPRAQALFARVRVATAGAQRSTRRRLTTRYGTKRRVRLSVLVPTGIAAAVVVVALVVASLPSGKTLHPNAPRHALSGAYAIRAKLLAALDANGDDVLGVTIFTGAGDTSASTCMTKQWIYPFDIQPGEEFREHVENCAGDFASAVDINAESVVADWLPTPATIGGLQQPGQTPTPGAHAFTPRVGVEVCGVGSQTGYDTSDDAPPNDVTWHATSETLHAPAPATPSLLRSELNAGSLQLVGNTTLDGQPTVELSVLAPSPSEVGSTYSETFWVDPATYLPMRAVMHWTNKQLPGAPPVQEMTTEWDFTFLQPTAANLGLLQVAVPAGLTTIPPLQTLVMPSCPFPPATNSGTTSNSGTAGTSGTPSS